MQYRNQNAEAILDHPGPQMLIVSGPGTGKSYLFMGQIDRWVRDQPEARVLVTSFVRQLVSPKLRRYIRRPAVRDDSSAGRGIDPNQRRPQLV